MAQYVISWPSKRTVDGQTYYLYLYSNQTMTAADGNYLRVGKSTGGDGSDTTVFVPPGSSEIVTPDSEYGWTDVSDNVTIEYEAAGNHFAYYSTHSWEYGITRPPETYTIIWPSAYEYRGETYYALKYSNQMDATSKYVQRRGYTNSSTWTTVSVTAPSQDQTPTAEYSGGTVPDYEEQLFIEATSAVRYYVNKRFDNNASSATTDKVLPTTNSTLSIPDMYRHYSGNYKDDIYAQLRNNISDVAQMLEHGLVGHRWNHPQIENWLQGGVSKSRQWFETVGRVKIYNNDTFNLDAVGTYATAVCLSGLAQYCTSRHWSFQLLAHLCLSMMSGRFDIMAHTTDTFAVQGKVYHKSLSDKTTPTAQDPEKDDYFVKLTSGGECPSKITIASTTSDVVLYSLDKSTGMFSRMQSIDPNDGNDYYIYDPVYEVTSVDHFDATRSHFYKDSDGIYMPIAIRSVSVLETAQEEYGTIYCSTDEGEYKSVRIRHYNAMMAYSSNSFALNGKDMFIRRRRVNGEYYYTPVGNTGRNQTAIIGYTMNNEFTSSGEQCLIWRAVVPGDRVSSLYTDKSNEHMENISNPVHVYLTHLAKAWQMLKRDRPAADIIGSTSIYNVGDLVDRLNAVVASVNPYVDETAGQRIIEHIDENSYTTRDLKLKSNEIVDFLEKDPKFLDACKMVTSSGVGFADFLPGGTMIAYEMIYDHVAEKGSWVDYNDLGFYYDPTNSYPNDIYRSIKWKSKPRPLTPGDIEKGRIFVHPDGDGHHYSVGTNTGSVPLKLVFDVKNIAHAWHDCDYNGSMQVLRLMEHDLSATDTNGHPWYEYLEQFEDESMPRKAHDELTELFGYISVMLRVGPIGANYIVDIMLHLLAHDPCWTDRTFNPGRAQEIYDHKTI